MPFSFGVLIKDRWSEDLPDFRERFFAREFLFILKVGDIKSNVADNAKVKKSAGISSLNILVILAFRIKGRISAETAPHIESFRIIGKDGQPKARNMKHTFDNFIAVTRRESGFRIMRNNPQDFDCAKHSTTSDKESDDSIINTTVKWRKDGSRYNVITVNDFFIIELNNATKVFSLANSNNAHITTDGETIVPSAIADFVFGREKSVRSDNILFIEIRFIGSVIES